LSGPHKGPWTRIAKKNNDERNQGPNYRRISYEHSRCGQANRGTSTGKR
jgi:hypothetical protein